MACTWPHGAQGSHHHTLHRFGARGNPPLKNTDGLYFFGGTFDPPHRGHLEIVRYILNAGPQNRVILVPAASAPLRSDDRLFSYAERFRLLRAALRSEIAAKRVILSTLERRRQGPKYTADTLAALEKICPQKPVVVVGADQAEKLASWHRGDYLLENYEFMVFARRGSPLVTPSGFRGRFVDEFAEDISATGMRGMLGKLPARERFRAALKLVGG